MRHLNKARGSRPGAPSKSEMKRLHFNKAQGSRPGALSKSEMRQVEDKCYGELKSRSQLVIVSKETFTCPYCPKMRKQGYPYHELLQHASGVGRSTSSKRSSMEKATHLALTKFLEKDLATIGELLNKSEMKEVEEKCYKELTSGLQRVCVSEETFTCPYCPKKGDRDYLYQELLQHASGVGKSSSKKRHAKDRGSHLALMKYLEKDLLSIRGPPKPVEEKFVWPWIGVVVNIPTRRAEDGRRVGESGSKFRDELIRRGFNPKRVTPLWHDDKGHSGYAVVEFNKGWLGLHNAMSFERAYEADGYGRKDWLAEYDNPKAGLYAWVARADDYNLSNILGEHLRKVGDVKTIPERMEEEARKQDKLVSNLTGIYEEKNKHFQELEEMYNKTIKDINDLVLDKHKLLQEYNEDWKIQTRGNDYFQMVMTNHQKLKVQLASVEKDLELRRQELEKREWRNENQRDKISKEIAENARRNSLLQLAALEWEWAIEKGDLQDRIVKLEKDLDEKQALELEIEQLRGRLEVMEHVEDGDRKEVFTKVDCLFEDLRNREDQLADLESLRRTLTARERRSNDELQDARKELIDVLQVLPVRSRIGVKRMGELDSEPFLEAMKLKYNDDEAEDRASELCSLWEEYLRDPGWHPFRTIEVNGEAKRVIKSDDEKLMGLKEQLGEKAYNAVVTAVMEVNEFNPSGSYVVYELWNYKERRKATLKEGVEVLLDLWNSHKNKRMM